MRIQTKFTLFFIIASIIPLGVTATLILGGAPNEASRARLLDTLLVLSFINTAMVTGFAILTARYISRPMVKLQGAAEKLAAGDLDQRVGLVGKDEINQLAKTFDVMARNLKASYMSLEEIKTRDEAMLASIGDGLIAVDRAGNIMLANQAAVRLLGRSRGELIDRDVFTIFALEEEDGRQLASKEHPIQQALRSSPTTTITTAAGQPLYCRRPDGTRFPIAITAAPIEIRGEKIGAVIIFRDITEEQRLDRSRKEFISIASHQLRTPLTTIAWYVELLAERAENEKQAKYLQQLDRSTATLIRLVNDLLSVSRLELGRFDLSYETAAPQTTVETVLEGLVQPLAEKSLTLERRLVGATAERRLPTSALQPTVEVAR